MLCNSQGVYVGGMHLIGLHVIGVHLIGVHLMGMQPNRSAEPKLVEKVTKDGEKLKRHRTFRGPRLTYMNNGMIMKH